MTTQPPALGEPNKQLSIISLVLGILSVTVCWLAAAIPAVITGHIAMNRTIGHHPSSAEKGWPRRDW
jgi:hypothetical protein